MFLRSGCSFVLALLACIGFGAQAQADPIDDFIQSKVDASKPPGLALLVMKDGAVVKEKGYGLANVELRAPVTSETLFQSGSTGKMFTAAGILLLVQEGKLNLDDRLAMYFTDAPATWHRISIRHLLTHTSGIKDYALIKSDDLDYRKDYSDSELLAVMEKLPLEFEPGTQWSYSNSGYLILGLLITKVTGKDYSELLADRIFKPLGMKTAQIISERRIVLNRAAGYEIDESGALKNQDWVSPGLNRTADGALYFSLEDLAQWERALEARSFMSSQSFAEWWTAVRLADGSRFPYGFGWFLSEQRGQPVILHGGAWQGFRATIVRYPEQKLTVVVLDNCAEVSATDIAREVAGMVDARLKSRTDLPPKAETDEAIAAVLRDVLQSWGNYRTTSNMSPHLATTATGSASEAHDRQKVANVVRAISSFRVLGSDRISRSAEDLLADGSVSAVDALVTETDGASASARFRLDSKGRVTGFEIEEHKLAVPPH